MSSPPGRVAVSRGAILLATLLAMACGGKGGDDGGRTDGSVELPDGRAPGRDGGQPGTDGGQPGADGGQPGVDGGRPGADGGQPGPSDAGAGPDAGLPAVAYCALVCSGPTDCGFNSAPYDSDNYDCQNNVCVYTGCNSDAECRALGNYLCRATAGSVMSFCHPACTTPADCNLGSAPYDSDNYDCENSVCVYTGCNSDAECRTQGNYLCRAVPGSSVPTCQAACTTPANCNMGSAPYDSDNYDCLDDVCVYTGCNSDAECRALGNYACPSGG